MVSATTIKDLYKGQAGMKVTEADCIAGLFDLGKLGICVDCNAAALHAKSNLFAGLEVLPGGNQLVCHSIVTSTLLQRLQDCLGLVCPPVDIAMFLCKTTCHAIYRLRGWNDQLKQEV